MYDEVVNDILDRDEISQIINSKEQFKCIKLDYFYNVAMGYNIKIYYTLEFDDSKSLNAEQLRLDNLMDHNTDDIYNIRFDSDRGNYSYIGFAEITATVDRTCNTIDYFISAEW